MKEETLREFVGWRTYASGIVDRSTSFLEGNWFSLGLLLAIIYLDVRTAFSYDSRMRFKIKKESTISKGTTEAYDEILMRIDVKLSLALLLSINRLSSIFNLV